jgi:hypothetical protein
MNIYIFHTIKLKISQENSETSVKTEFLFSGNYLYSKEGFEADTDIKAIIVFDKKNLLQRVMQRAHAFR